MFPDLAISAIFSVFSTVLKLNLPVKMWLIVFFSEKIGVFVAHNIGI